MHEPTKNSSATIGNYYFQLFTDGFTDRRQSLYLYGVPGSGKSTVAQLVLTIFDDKNIFIPDYGSSFPFGTYEDTHLIGNLNEFRASPKHSSSQWLLFLERSSLYIDRKGKSSEFIKEPPPSVVTSNILTPNASWATQDIHALSERCVMITWVHPLPESIVRSAKKSALHSRCRRCAGCTILWTSQQLRDLFPMHQMPRRPHPPSGQSLNAEQLAYVMPRV